MHLTDLIHLRETEAQKIARFRGRGRAWDDTYNVADEDRDLADEIVKAGLTLGERTSQNTMRESHTENHPPITEATCQRLRGYIDQHAGICCCGFDSEDMNDGGYTLDHIVHSLVDDWQGFLATTRPTPPSQYGLQVLVNADSRSARWAFHEDYPLAASEADAWRYLTDALDSGHAPHHLRVVALHVVEPR